MHCTASIKPSEDGSHKLGAFIQICVPAELENSILCEAADKFPATYPVWKVIFKETYGPLSHV